jgi:hypothetical protein
MRSRQPGKLFLIELELPTEFIVKQVASYAVGDAPAWIATITGSPAVLLEVEVLLPIIGPVPHKT